MIPFRIQRAKFLFLFVSVGTLTSHAICFINPSGPSKVSSCFKPACRKKRKKNRRRNSRKEVELFRGSENWSNKKKTHEKRKKTRETRRKVRKREILWRPRFAECRAEGNAPDALLEVLLVDLVAESLGSQRLRSRGAARAPGSFSGFDRWEPRAATRRKCEYGARRADPCARPLRDLSSPSYLFSGCAGRPCGYCARFLASRAEILIIPLKNNSLLCKKIVSVVGILQSRRIILWNLCMFWYRFIIPRCSL